jgi:transcriptional regulator with XRE-family HTH domain
MLVLHAVSPAKGTENMKTFGQVILEARKAAGLTQKAVAERLRREDGRRVLPPWLNDLEHDRRYPPENAVIEQLAKLLHISVDVLYFYAKRVPGDVEGDFDDSAIEAAYCAFRRALSKPYESDRQLQLRPDAMRTVFRHV